MIVAGIDEAGLGPVLGPLVVSAAALSVPTKHARADLWELLNNSVAKKPQRKGRGPIAIGDSKKLYNRKTKNGLVPLERGVLSAVCALSKNLPPANIGELYDSIAPGASQASADYLWYNSLDFELPSQAGRLDIKLSADELNADLQNNEMSLVGLRAIPVFAKHYNSLIAHTQNKSTAVFSITCQLIDCVCQSWPTEDIRLVVDRQGGRVHYLEPLQKVFPDCQFKILEESEKRSAYRVAQNQRVIEIEFLVGGEQASLVTALASMLSKYIRELNMIRFNRFWESKVENIAHTAGYYVDGNRFFSEIRDTMEDLNIAEDMIYRCR